MSKIEDFEIISELNCIVTGSSDSVLRLYRLSFSEGELKIVNSGLIGKES